MKKYKIIPIVLLISLNIGSIVYSQNDSTRTILTREGFSINYIAGFKNVYNEAFKKDNRIPYNAEINHIKKLKFMTDSTVKVTAKDSCEEINIDKINEISFESGNNFWKGAGIGALSGLAVGFLGGFIFTEDIWKGAIDGDASSEDKINSGIIIGILGLPAGAIIGGIIGVSIPSEKDSLTLSAVKGDKKEKLLKFLKRNNKTIKNIR